MGARAALSDGTQALVQRGRNFPSDGEYRIESELAVLPGRPRKPRRFSADLLRRRLQFFPEARVRRRKFDQGVPRAGHVKTVEPQPTLMRLLRRPGRTGRFLLHFRRGHQFIVGYALEE